MMRKRIFFINRRGTRVKQGNQGCKLRTFLQKRDGTNWELCGIQKETQFCFLELVFLSFTTQNVWEVSFG